MCFIPADQSVLFPTSHQSYFFSPLLVILVWSLQAYPQTHPWHTSSLILVPLLVAPQKEKCVAQSTLCIPMDCSHQAPLSMEFSRQKCWSGLPFPSPGESSQPREEKIAFLSNHCISLFVLHLLIFPHFFPSMSLTVLPNISVPCFMFWNLVFTSKLFSFSSFSFLKVTTLCFNSCNNLADTSCWLFSFSMAYYISDIYIYDITWEL